MKKNYFCLVLCVVLCAVISLSFYRRTRQHEPVQRSKKPWMRVEIAETSKTAVGVWMGLESSTSVLCGLVLLDNGTGFYVHDILYDEDGQPISVKWDYREGDLSVWGDNTDREPWVDFRGGFGKWGTESQSDEFIFLVGHGAGFNYDVVLYREHDWIQKAELLKEMCY